MESSPDLLFGKIAVKNGFLTTEQVAQLVEQQAQAVEAGVPTTLGELCQMKRLLTSEQVQQILLAQEFALVREEDRRLGSLAVRNGLASEEDVQAALDEQKRSYREDRRLPRRIGEILVNMGVLPQRHLDALLRAQERLSGQAPASPSAKSPAPGTAASASSRQAIGWLVQEAGEGVGCRFSIGAKAVLGRQPTNEVPIAEDQASRQHARIEFIPLARQHVVADMNSRNGTFVNEEIITGPVALRSGDRIRIGTTIFRYEAGPAIAPGAVAPDETAVAPPALRSQRRIDTVVAPGANGAVPAGRRPIAAGTRSPAVSVGNPAGARERELTNQASSGRRAEERRPCPECGHEVSERARFCKGCGAAVAPRGVHGRSADEATAPSPGERVSAAHGGAIPVPQAACASCGKASPVGAIFCPACGASLTGAEQPGIRSTARTEGTSGAGATSGVHRLPCWLAITGGGMMVVGLLLPSYEATAPFVGKVSHNILSEGTDGKLLGVLGVSLGLLGAAALYGRMARRRFGGLAVLDGLIGLVMTVLTLSAIAEWEKEVRGKGALASTGVGMYLLLLGSALGILAGGAALSDRVLHDLLAGRGLVEPHAPNSPET